MIPHFGTKELAALAVLSISASMWLIHGFAFGLLAFGLLMVGVLIVKSIFSICQ